MSQTRRRLKLTFESDWHIGTGAGIPGSVDRQVLRDGDGLPYVPGKTLTGILRDAAEWVADIRDALKTQEQTNGGKWRKAVDSLFGHQPETHGGAEGKEAQPAKIGVGSARLGEDVRRCVVDADEAGRGSGLLLSSALVQVHPGVKIDPDTGRAQENHLFSTERARWDCVLYAEIAYLAGGLEEDEARLLDDAIKAVRRVGGKRRRGAGACRLAWDGEPFVVDGTGEGKTPLDLKDVAQDGAVSLDVRLTALQPILVNRKNVGNAIETDTEIPGATLLSYYAQEVLAPLGEERVRRAIMEGEISVGTFLPEFEGRKALPVPLCLAEEKEERDGEKKIVNGLTGCSDPGIQTKDLRSGYVVPHGEDMIYYAASDQKIVRTHNTIDDEVQRPTEDVGGLFTYEAIQAGKAFRGTLKIGKALWEEIRGSDGKDGILKKLSRDEHTFGRSRKDEYGRALLECEAADAASEEALSQMSPIEAGGHRYLVVYLASDLLLRDEAMSWSVKVKDVRGSLERALGTNLQDIPEDEWTKKEQEGGREVQISPLGGPRGHSVRIGRRESWQVSWGLPRPSLVYFKAGSVFLFKVLDPEGWNEERARRLVKEGLGERRAEGYGRVLLSPPFLCGGSKVMRLERSEEQDGPSEVEVTLPGSEEGRRFVGALAGDAVRRRFRQLARQEAYHIVHRAPATEDLFSGCPGAKWCHRPSASQFGALREAAATIEGGEKGRDIFLKWVESVGKHKEKEDRWNEEWCKMFDGLGRHPEGIWAIRDAFGGLKEAALRQGILDEGKLDDMAPSLLGAFLDILCEAVFDKAKQEDSERGGDGA